MILIQLRTECARRHARKSRLAEDLCRKASATSRIAKSPGPLSGGKQRIVEMPTTLRRGIIKAQKAPKKQIAPGLAHRLEARDTLCRWRMGGEQAHQAFTGERLNDEQMRGRGSGVHG
jgi:hypothetical protein